MPSTWNGRLASALLAVALLVRVALIVAQPGFVPVGDAVDYDAYAVSIARTGHYPPSTRVPSGEPTAIRPPAYPYLLGGAYAVTGASDTAHRYVVGRVLGAVLGVFTVALIGLVAYLLWGSLASLCTMAIASVYPELVAVSDSLLSETLFTPLVLASVGCLLMLRRSRGYSWVAGAGLFAGLAALTRVNGIVVVLALLGGLWALGRGRRVRAALILIATTAVVLTPWVVRDAVDFHTFVPISTETGYTLEGTYNDVSRADAQNPAAWRPALAPPYIGTLRRRDLNEAQMDTKLRSIALRYIRKHPAYLAKVVLWNGLRLLQFTGNRREQRAARETGVGPKFSDISRYAFWVVLILACVALLTMPKARHVPVVVWAVPILLILTTIFVNASARYREPIDPFLILAAALPIAQLVAKRLPQQTRR